MKKESLDHLEIRCPMLGHPLNFSYCRSTTGDTPCRRIYNCWFERLDIETYMNENFSEDVIEKIKTPAQPKMMSLLELIEQAKKNQENA